MSREWIPRVMDGAAVTMVLFVGWLMLELWRSQSAARRRVRGLGQPPHEDSSLPMVKLPDDAWARDHQRRRAAGLPGKDGRPIE